MPAPAMDPVGAAVGAVVVGTLGVVASPGLRPPKMRCIPYRTGGMVAITISVVGGGSRLGRLIGPRVRAVREGSLPTLGSCIVVHTEMGLLLSSVVADAPGGESGLLSESASRSAGAEGVPRGTSTVGTARACWIKLWACRSRSNRWCCTDDSPGPAVRPVPASAPAPISTPRMMAERSSNARFATARRTASVTMHSGWQESPLGTLLSLLPGTGAAGAGGIASLAYPASGRAMPVTVYLCFTELVTENPQHGTHKLPTTHGASVTHPPQWVTVTRGQRETQR
jgi:hypothetical protein